MADLSPLDVLATTFPRALRGYSPAAVHELMAQVAATLEASARERGDLRQQLHRLEQEVASYRQREHALQEALVTAQRTAERTLAEAQAEGQRIVEEGQQLADRLVEEAHHRAQNIEALIAGLRNRRREARADLLRLLEVVEGVIQDDQQLERTEPTAAQLTLLHRRRGGSGEGQR